MTAQELNNLLGDNIKHYRKQKGWTGAQLARKAGVHGTIISWYEHGKHLPSGRSLVNIAYVLGVEVWQLFFNRNK